MDDLGNIVYVLIAIGWFLLSAYRKSQKNKQKRTQPGPQQTEPVAEERESWAEKTRSLEDLIMEQLGEKQPEAEPDLPAGRPEPEPVPAHANEGKFLSTDLTHSHLPDDYVMGRDEMKSHRVQRQVRKVKVEVEQEESLVDRLLPNGFDLQQAVVLNAILERPYR